MFGDLSKEGNIKRMKNENIKDGDFVRGPHIMGVYYRGGVIIDYEDEFTTDMESDGWRNI